MAGQDVYENEMRTVNGVDYLRGLLGEDSVLLNPASLLSNTLKMVNSWAININCNDINENGVYVVAGQGITNAPFVYGILLHIGDEAHKLQLFADSEGKYYIRSLWGTTWRNWKQI